MAVHPCILDHLRPLFKGFGSRRNLILNYEMVVPLRNSSDRERDGTWDQLGIFAKCMRRSGFLGLYIISLLKMVTFEQLNDE